MKGSYVNGLSVDHWVHYYDNGKVKLDLYYNNGMLDGILTGYDTLGNMLEQAEYRDNQLIRQIKNQ